MPVRRPVGEGWRGDERGLSLVEVIIAMAIFAMVIVAVDVSVSIITERTTGASETASAVDQLQVAEQTIVQAVHAANSWCTPVPTPAYGCATFTTAPTSQSLDFTAELDGGTATYVFTIANHTLTETRNGGQPVTLLTNVDPSSGFTADSHTESNGTTYYTAVGVQLTVDSPSVTARRPVRTTAADSSVDAWNVEYACSAYVESESAEGEAC